jgi:hypothetical protein
MKKGAPFYAKQLLALYEEGPINERSDENRLRKERFHLLAKQLLNTLADALSLTGYNILSSHGGRHMIGDVTLRCDTMKIRIIGSLLDEERVDFMNQQNGHYFSDMTIIPAGLKDFEQYDALLAKVKKLLPEVA